MRRFITTTNSPAVTRGAFTERTRRLPEELRDYTSPEPSAASKVGSAINRMFRIGEFVTGFVTTVGAGITLGAERFSDNVDFDPQTTAQLAIAAVAGALLTIDSVKNFD